MFTGRLIYLMGPSGAGKDSLIAHIKLKNELPLLLPSRYITRPVNAAELEQHQFMTPEAFAAAEQAGEFACSWRANGHAYGLGLDVYTGLEQGKMVLINGSRAHYKSLPEALQAACVPVYLHVGSEVQTQRLLQRGRENTAQVAERVARSQVLAQALPEGCVKLNAEQSLDAVYADFKQQVWHKECAA